MNFYSFDISNLLLDRILNALLIRDKYLIVIARQNDKGLILKYNLRCAGQKLISKKKFKYFSQYPYATVFLEKLEADYNGADFFFMVPQIGIQCWNIKRVCSEYRIRLELPKDQEFQYSAFKLSPSGNEVAIGLNQRFDAQSRNWTWIYIYDLVERNTIKKFQVDQFQISMICFLKNSTKLLVSGNTRKIIIADWEKGVQERKIKISSKRFHNAQDLSPNGNIMASGAFYIEIMDLRKKQDLLLRKFGSELPTTPQVSYYVDFKFVNKEKLIAIKDQQAEIWDWQKGTLLKKIVLTDCNYFRVIKTKKDFIFVARTMFKISSMNSFE